MQVAHCLCFRNGREVLLGLGRQILGVVIEQDPAKPSWSQGARRSCETEYEMSPVPCSRILSSAFTGASWSVRSRTRSSRSQFSWRSVPPRSSVR